MDREANWIERRVFLRSGRRCREPAVASGRVAPASPRLAPTYDASGIERSCGRWM